MDAAKLAEIEAIKRLTAHYHDQYVKQAGRWRIRRLCLTRLEIMPL